MNGLQHRQSHKFKFIVDSMEFFEQCMAETAADVGAESTFTARIAHLIAHGLLAYQDVSASVPQDQLQSAMTGKCLVLVRDQILEGWFHLCKVVSCHAAKLY